MSNSLELPAFDVLVAFHKRDPVGYEKFRVKTLNAAVAAVPYTRRAALDRTLRVIEATRQAAGSPWECAVAAQVLMWQSVKELVDALYQFQHASAEIQAALVIQQARSSSVTQAVSK